ncbi:MAG: 7TM domain-containing protein [Candidatus Shapirobacteria bacterium]
MKKITARFFIFGVLFLVLWLTQVSTIKAVNSVKTATKSAVATNSAIIEPTVVPVVKPNIVEEQGKNVNYKVEKWNGFNSIRVVVKWAMDRGVSTNTIVLLLLLPLIATLVSVLHYVVGVTGYGIFMPTMIAITFLATGIFGGLLLFAMILLISVCSSFILKKFKIHFWPARAISLLFISLGTFGLMILSSFTKIVDISRISIFPILFMILLAEESVRTQLVKSKKEARNLMAGTLVLAIIGAGIMKFEWIQGVVLNSPELVILIVLIINLIVGNYTGMRLTEIQRFKRAIREKK